MGERGNCEGMQCSMCNVNTFYSLDTCTSLSLGCVGAKSPQYTHHARTVYRTPSEWRLCNLKSAEERNGLIQLHILDSYREGTVPRKS